MSQLTQTKPRKIAQNTGNEAYQSDSKLLGTGKAVHNKGRQILYNLIDQVTTNKPQRYLQKTALSLAKKTDPQDEFKKEKGHHLKN